MKNDKMIDGDYFLCNSFVYTDDYPSKPTLIDLMFDGSQVM